MVDYQRTRSWSSLKFPPSVTEEDLGNEAYEECHMSILLLIINFCIGFLVSDLFLLGVPKGYYSHTTSLVLSLLVSISLATIVNYYIHHFFKG